MQQTHQNQLQTPWIIQDEELCQRKVSLLIWTLVQRALLVIALWPWPSGEPSCSLQTFIPIPNPSFCPNNNINSGKAQIIKIKTPSKEPSCNHSLCLILKTSTWCRIARKFGKHSFPQEDQLQVHVTGEIVDPEFAFINPESGLHKLCHPTIRDGSTWSKFRARGEHGDVFLFSNLGELWFSENLIR